MKDETKLSGEGETRRDRARKAGWQTWTALGLSAASIVIAASAAFATWMQVQVSKEAISEALVVSDATTGVAYGDGEFVADIMDGNSDSLEDDETVAIFLDVANMGRSDGFVRELVVLSKDRGEISIPKARCLYSTTDAYEECSLPFPVAQGEKLKIRLDFDLGYRDFINCPNGLDDYYFFILRDSNGKETRVGVSRLDRDRVCPQ